MRLEIDVLRLKYPLLEDTQSSVIHMHLKNGLESTNIRKGRYLLARSAAVSISTCESELPFCGHMHLPKMGKCILISFFSFSFFAT